MREVKNLVNLLVCSDLYTTLLLRDILRPLRYWFLHVNRRWDHVSLAFCGHSEQLGLGCMRGQNIFFLWLPMYCA